MIPYGRQHVTPEDIRAVEEVLRSDWLTQGPAVPRFESAIATYCRVPHAVAVNSATSALHLACRALGLGPGDSLWTSPISFVASANCGLYCGARVDFVDIDPITYNLSPRALEEKLARARTEGRLPKVVIPVHFAGQSCEMEEIGALARAYDVRVIEDASHAIGAWYEGEPVGCCRHSDIAVFSFHPVKIITTGEGGVAVTQRPDLARKMELLRSHGVTRVADEMTGSSEGAWYYEQVDLGYNYRMTDLQAALGASQMTRLDEYVSRRHEIAGRYDRLLAELPLVLPRRPTGSRSALHLYPIQVDRRRTSRSRAEVFAGMREAGVGVNVHYIPIHLQPYYRALGFQAGDFPIAEAYFQGAISLPMFPTLADVDQTMVVDALRKSTGA